MGNKSIVALIFCILLLGLASAISITQTTTPPSITNNRSEIIAYNISTDNMQSLIYSFNNTNYSLFDSSLILFYNFDNRSSLGESDTVVKDLSMYGNNGTVVGGSNISWTSQGYSRGSFNFSGNTNYVSSNVSNLTQATVSFWIKIANDVQQTAISQSNAFEIRGPNNHYFWITFSNATATKSVYTDNTISTNTWYHVVGIYNGTTVYSFVNGVKQTSTLTMVGNLNWSNSALYIGRNTAGSLKFNGTIDNVLVYNRSLSDDEIATLYNSQITKYNSQNWSIQNNQSTSSYLQNYYLCSSNVTQNVCTSQNNIRRLNNINSVFTSKIGNIANYFYGANTHRPNYLTSSNDATWLENAWLNSKMNYMRIDANIYSSGLSEYSNTTNSNGVNFTGNIINTTLEITWAKQNGIKTLVIASFMPTWLADNSSGKCTNLNLCPPNNATIYANIVLDYFYRIGCNSDTCEIEVWNEPYGSPFMGGLNNDNLDKAKNYTAMYDVLYNVIKANNSAIQIGGPSGYRTAKNLTTTFLTNESGKFDFLTIHPYGFNRINSLEQYQDIKDLYANCTALGVSCNRVIMSEWNVGDAYLQNLTYTSSEYGNSIAQSYKSILTNYSDNITSILYQWTELSKYNSSYTEYPKKFEMVSGPSYDNSYAPSYNVTKSFATYCPAGGQVYSSSSDDSYLQTVSCIDNSGKKNLIIINTDSNAQNVSLSNVLKGLSATNTKLMNPYDILYLSNVNLENSQSYLNIVTSLSQSTFAINYTYNLQSYSSSIPILVYNNISYLGTVALDSGNNSIASYTLTIPFVNSNTSENFYWMFGLVNSSGTNYFYSSLKNQTAVPISIDDCTSNTNLLINFTMKDEENLTTINYGTYNTQIQIGDLNMNNYFSFNNNKTSNYSAICVQALTSDQLRMDYLVQYNSPGYVTRYYNAQNISISNNSYYQNKTLYDLLTAQAQSFQITALDSNYLALQNVIIDIGRVYVQTGQNFSITAPLTDSNGKVTDYFTTASVPTYNFYVKRNGQLIYAFLNQKVYCQTPSITTCIINLNTPASTFYIDSSQCRNGICYTQGYNYSTGIYTLSFTSVDSTQDQVNITGILFDKNLNVTVCSQDTTSLSGSLVCQVPSGYYNSTIIFVANANNKPLFSDTINTGSSLSGVLMKSRYVLAAMLIPMFVLMAVGSASLSLVMLVFGFIFCMLIYLLDTQSFVGASASIIWLIVAVGIVIWKISKKGRGD